MTLYNHCTVHFVHKTRILNDLGSTQLDCVPQEDPYLVIVSIHYDPTSLNNSWTLLRDSEEPGLHSRSSSDIQTTRHNNEKE